MAIAIVFMSLEFGWSSTVEGLILSSFFVGYLTTQVVGGTLSDRFGGKWVLSVAAALWTTFTFLTPITARHGLAPLMLCRICLGVGEGACFPSVHSLIAAWFPPEERSRAVSTITSSSLIGVVIATPVSTWLATSPLGWESIFWVFGIVGCIWSVFWHFLGASSPVDYPGISKEELSWILKSECDVAHNNQGYDRLEPGTSRISVTEDVGPEIESSKTATATEEDGENTELLKDGHLEVVNAFTENPVSSENGIPWKFIFSRKEVWAILVVQFCNSWVYFIMLNWLPIYYLDHFGVDIKNLGYFAALPYASQGVMGFVVGIIGDHLVNRLNTRVISVRRGAQLVGSLGISTFLLLATHLAKTPIQGLLLITIGNSLGSFLLIGVHMSQLDIAPKYAGAIWGLGNTFAIIPGILGVALTGWILDVTGKNWNIIWNLAVLLHSFGTALFVLWVGDKVIIG